MQMEFFAIEQGSPVAKADANGTMISRTHYEPDGYVASGDQPTIAFTGM